MATLLSRSHWAKISVFVKKGYFLLRNVFISDCLARIWNQRLRIDPYAKFQLHWTKDEGARVMTWNDNKNGLMTSYFPPGDDVSKRFMVFWEILSQSTIMPSLVVIGSQIKEKQCASPAYMEQTPAWIGLESLKVQYYGVTHVHNDYFFRSTIILWKILYFILFGHTKTDF